MAFGFSLPKPPRLALGGDPSSGSSLSLADKLMMFGAIAKGHPDLAMQIPLMAEARDHARQQEAATSDLARVTSGAPIPSRAEMAAKIDPANALPPEPTEASPAPPLIDKASDPYGLASGVSGMSIPPRKLAPITTYVPPRDPSADVGGGQVTLRNALPFLAKAAQRGVNIEPWTKLITGAQPKSVVVNGRVLDEHDPSIYGGYYGDAPAKGAEPVYDRQGKQVGWHMADGAIQAIGSAANAEARGQQSAQAEFAGPIERAKQSAQADFAGPIAAGTAAGKAAVENPNTLETHDLNGAPTTMTRQQWLAISGGGGGGGGAQPPALTMGGAASALAALLPGARITSMGRTPEHNAAVGGVPDSMHLGAHAMDFVPPKGVGLDAFRAKLVAAGLPVTELLNEGDHIHWGWGPKGGEAAAAPAGRQASGFHGINAADAKRVETYADDASTAEDVSQKAHQFQELNKKTFTGPVFNPARVHVPFVGEVPLNPVSGIGSAFQPGAQAMDRLSMQIASGLRAPGQRLTQAEIFQNLKTVPRRGSLPDSNDTNVAVIDNTAATKRAYATFMSDWLTSNGTLNGADAAWAHQQTGGGRVGAAPASGAGPTRAGPPMKAQPMQQIKLKSGGTATVVPVG